MDPFSNEGELLNIHNAFHQSQYTTVVDFDTSSLSSANALPAQVLKLRAKIALGDVDAVLNESDDSPDIQAVKALAQNASGNADEAVASAEEFVENFPENATVQVCCGTVLAAAGKEAEALTALAKHQGNLEAVALIVQIHLQQNRADLALKEVQAAKRWAQDSLLINLAEAWVGLRTGGESYQSTFYVYEELASAPSTSSITSLIGQAVSELHLGRLPEAEAALQQVLAAEQVDPQGIANAIVLANVMGKKSEDVQALKSQLEKKIPQHAFLRDIAEKSQGFDTAAAKYKPKVAS